MIPIAADHRHPPAPWPCRRCALVLGSIHLIGAFSLLLVDISTNDRSETAFAIATALIAFICGLFAFVAARRRRRFDRTVLRLLAVFATVAIGVCIALFIENVVRINSDQRWRDRSLSIVHAMLISAALIEGNPGGWRETYGAFANRVRFFSLFPDPICGF